MLRTIVEVASYGKVSQVTDRALIYRAVGDTTSLGAWYRQQTLGPNKKLAAALHFDYPSLNLKGGYLCRHQGDWAIRPARCDASTYDQSIIRVPFDRLGPTLQSARLGRHQVHPVYVVPAPRRDTPRGDGGLVLNMAETPESITRRDPARPTSSDHDMVPAWLIESGVLGGKKSQYAIYEPDSKAKPIPIPPSLWEQYLEDRELNRGDGRGSRALGKKTDLLEGDGDPLFYLVDHEDKLIFFGPTMMFRLPYQRSPKDLIPEPLRQPLDIDFADALFGYIRRAEDFRQAGKERPEQGDPEWAYAGRVSVSDATLEDGQSGDDLFLPELTPRILSSPKPTAFQHYLVQGRNPSSPIRRPEDLMSLDADSVVRTNLSHYDSPTPDMDERLRGQHTVLRGTKFYWHQGLRTTHQLAQPGEIPESSSQHTRMTPVAPHKTFVFSVHFDNLSDAELGALCWALHPRGHEGRQYRHSLGMGKPLGMGAVKLEAELRLTNRRERYTRLLDINHNHWESGSGRPQDLSDPAVRDALVEPFEDRILNDLGVKDCASLAHLRRLGALLKLMDWPGPDPERSLAWDIELEGWQPWKDRRVLPPTSDMAFGDSISRTSVPAPSDSREVLDWRVARERGDAEPVVEPGEHFASADDLRNALAKTIGLTSHATKLKPEDTQTPNVPVVDRDAELEKIANWNENQLARNLGRDGNKVIKAFSGAESELIATLSKHHSETLRSWRESQDKSKSKAARNWEKWRRTHGGTLS